MHDEKDNECPFCDGTGFLLEDKDQFYYFGADQLRKASKEKDGEWKQRMIDGAMAMKGKPMQPLAVECPKCGGTGRRPPLE